MEREQDDSPYHAGERAVQTRLGVRARSEQMGRKLIRSFMPDQHRELFAELPFLVAGSLDAEGQPWASILVGPAGFIRTPDARTLCVRTLPFAGDPLATSLAPGRALGLLGIQLDTRRRNRVNGRVIDADADGFALRVDQSFGNCPQYISARVPERVERAAARPPELEAAALSARARAWIAASDTCFVASASGPAQAIGATSDAREGVDVSHRGGAPGFVACVTGAGGSALLMPDYAGNNAFNTLGNLQRYPRAGLLFPDFDTGDLLLLACRAEVVWQGAELERFRGAQRLVRFAVERGLRLSGRLPFRWSAPAPWPGLGSS